MPIDVNSLLDMFNDFEVIAGHKGLERKVTTVTVMDAPDIHEWLKGGEFLMTTAYIMKDHPLQIKELVERIDNRGAAALGIKLKRFVYELPAEVLVAANERALPIIYIPSHYAFRDIINPVLSHIVNEQARLLARSEQIRRSFTELVIRGGNVDQILATLQAIVEKEVAFFDRKLGKVYISGENPDFHAVISTNDLERIAQDYHTYTLTVENRVYGHLVLNLPAQDSLREYDKIALEHAKTVLILDIQRKISQLQVESRYRDQLVQDLIFNNIRSEDEVVSRARMFNWRFHHPVLCVIVDIDNFKIQYFRKGKQQVNPEELHEKVLSLSREYITRAFPDTVYTSFSDYMVFLVQSEITMPKLIPYLRSVLEELRETVKLKTGFTVTIGVGNMYPTVAEAHLSYKEAQKAVKTSRLIGPGNTTVFYCELGAYALLAPLVGSKEAEEFVATHLGKLPQAENSVLLDTLWHIVGANWNLKAAAQRLHLHYNTVKYRYQKISVLLGRDLDNSEVRLSVTLALKLLKMSS